MTCPRCNQLHRRTQLAEAALAAVDPERLERAGRSGGSFGRSALRWVATKSTEERDEARAMAAELAEALAEVVTLGPGTKTMETLARYRKWREALQ